MERLQHARVPHTETAPRCTGKGYDQEQKQLATLDLRHHTRASQWSEMQASQAGWKARPASPSLAQSSTV
jgi:hypothetical protein